ncbi:hypothetical protein MIDIC_340029 [Alphaproteobacteria bacterium]
MSIITNSIRDGKEVVDYYPLGQKQEKVCMYGYNEIQKTIGF